METDKCTINSIIENDMLKEDKMLLEKLSQRIKILGGLHANTYESNIEPQ